MSHSENVREFYRRQGAEQERQRILAELQKLFDYRTDALWSPKYLMDLIEGKK
jgi:hypothetical protein